MQNLLLKKHISGLKNQIFLIILKLIFFISFYSSIINRTNCIIIKPLNFPNFTSYRLSFLSIILFLYNISDQNN